MYISKVAKKEAFWGQWTLFSASYIGVEAFVFQFNLCLPSGIKVVVKVRQIKDTYPGNEMCLLAACYECFNCGYYLPICHHLRLCLAVQSSHVNPRQPAASSANVWKISSGTV